MKKIAVLLAPGFEVIEALTPLDYVKRAGGDAVTVSVSNEVLEISSNAVKVGCGLKIKDLKVEDFDGVVLPGGLPGATNLRDNADVMRVVKAFNDAGKLVASICAGPIALEKAGVIEGRMATSYPGFGEQMKSCEYIESPVVKDANIITARGPAISGLFSLAIVEYLFGEKVKNEVSQGILQYML